MSDAQQKAAHAPTIVVVDDEGSVRDGVRFLLEDAGYRTQFAQNGKEALHLIGTSTPALVLTDLMMPEMSGAELANSMKAIPSLALIPCILMTGAYLSADLGRSTLFSHVLQKPFTAKQLLEKVANLLGQEQNGPNTGR